MSLDYDGVTSLRLEIKNRLNKTSHQTQADYIAAACVALGFDKRKKGDNGAALENKAILQWLLDNKTTTRNKTQNKSQITILETITPIIETPAPAPKTRNKVKRENRFNQFKRISFNVTGNTQRQHISLEPEFIKALELIAPANKLQWLSDTVSDYIVKNGIESTTRIIKSAIVNELLKRATVVKK